MSENLDITRVSGFFVFLTKSRFRVFQTVLERLKWGQNGVKNNKKNEKGTFLIKKINFLKFFVKDSFLTVFFLFLIDFKGGIYMGREIKIFDMSMICYAFFTFFSFICCR